MGGDAAVWMGKTSDATERKGELHRLSHIRNILRVDIGTPAVIAANAHLLADGTNHRVMDRGQLVGLSPEYRTAGYRYS